MALASWDRPLAIQMGANITIHAPFDSLTVQPTHPSVKVLQTFTCPKDPQRNGARMVPLVPGSFADGMADGNGICRSYVLNLGSGNSMIGKDDGVSANADAIPVVKIDSGAGTVFLIESHGYATVFGQANIANDTTIVGSRDGIFKPADAFTNPSVVPMHGKKSKPLINALMYDGHVESIESTYLIANGCELMQYIK
jgi:prepilin-type processing-associated H-X9-DG protein